MKLLVFRPLVCVLVGLLALLDGVCADVAPSAEIAAEQISSLRAEIARHDALYHRQAAPEISDFDYDQLKRRLAQLEREFPEAARSVPAIAEVGDDRSGLFQTYRHRERMLSLERRTSPRTCVPFTAG